MGLIALLASDSSAQNRDSPLVVSSVTVRNPRGGAFVMAGAASELAISVQNISRSPLIGAYVVVTSADYDRLAILGGNLGGSKGRSQRIEVGTIPPGASATAKLGVLLEQPKMGWIGVAGGSSQGKAPVWVQLGAQGLQESPRMPYDLSRIQEPTSQRISQVSVPPDAQSAGSSLASQPAAAVGGAASVPQISASLSIPVNVRREERPDAVAVIIGNRSYRRAPSVDYAVNDAAAMRMYAERVLGVRPGNILFYEDASLSDMKSLFGDVGQPDGRLKDLVKPGRSEVFVFYSGHGAPDASARRAYLIPVDGDANRLSLTALSVDALYDNLAALKAKHVTVLIDACFSGASGGGGMLITAASPIGIQVNDPASKFGGDGATIVAAAQGQQLANWQTEEKHGMLTYYFLKGLQGGADRDKDGKVTVGEIKAWLTDPLDGLPYEARRLHGRDQMPQIWGNDSRPINP